jgi:hypothetical protein
MSVFRQGEYIHKGCGDGTLNLAGKFCRFNPYNFQNRCKRYIFENGLRLGVASSVKLLYLGILYRFIGAGNFFSVFSIASSVKKMLPNKIVSLYLIFFSKIVYQYRFNRYIFEYRCPPMLLREERSPICMRV